MVLFHVENEFLSSCDIIRDASSFDESRLSRVNRIINLSAKPISEDFGDDFKRAINQTD